MKTAALTFASLYLVVAVTACAPSPTQDSTAKVAAEPLELDIALSTYTLKERGSAVKTDAVVIPGTKSESECVAFVLDERLEGRKHCALSGFSTSSAPDASYLGCTVSREINSYRFVAHLWPRPSGSEELSCDFMCY